MSCKFCGSQLISVRNLRDYLLCQNCETFARSSGDEQTTMVNENLKGSLKPDRLTLELLGILKARLETNKSNLIDFGCGAGRFLLLAKQSFNNVAGVEITPASISVARSNGLEIFSEIQSKGYHVITFWHSLEHLPYETVIKVLEKLKLSEINTVVLSVPNSNSISLKYFGNYDAFVDVSNHTFIFSKKLLEKMFLEYGFKLSATPIIKSYTLFGAIQSSVNFVTHTKNQLYFILKRGGSIKNIRFIRHLILSPIYLTLILFVLSFVSIRKNRDATINLCFERIRK
jgi:SAM-dependent methyltransferase